MTPSQMNKFRKNCKYLKEESINAQVEVIFQTIEGLHRACPKNLGDWYFSGNYPTPGDAGL